MEEKEDNLIYSYTDQQAINDGVIIYLDSKNRVTNNAFIKIQKKYNYSLDETLKFIYCELMPIIPYAKKTFDQGGILKSDFNFKVGNFKHTQILWYIPNENQGITLMLPEDY